MFPSHDPWVRRILGVSDQKKARGIAFAISRKKKRQRTPGQHFAEETFDSNINSLNQNFLNPVGAEIVRTIG